MWKHKTNTKKGARKRMRRIKRLMREMKSVMMSRLKRLISRRTEISGREG